MVGGRPTPSLGMQVSQLISPHAYQNMTGASEGGKVTIVKRRRAQIHRRRTRHVQTYARRASAAVLRGGVWRESAAFFGDVFGHV